MKKVLLPLFCIMMMACVSVANNNVNGQTKVKASGVVKSEVRNLSGFDGIKVCCGIEVQLTQDASFSVRVESDEKFLPYVSTSLDDGKLVIGYSRNISLRTKQNHTTVYISMPAIESIDAVSGSAVYGQNALVSSDLKIKVSAGALFKGTVSAEKLSLDTSSGALITVEGKASKCSMGASSGSRIAASELVCRNLDADLSSGANISAHAIKQLKVDASSGADFVYSGTPKEVSVSKSSGGSVNAKR